MLSNTFDIPGGERVYVSEVQKALLCNLLKVLGNKKCREACLLVITRFGNDEGDLSVSFIFFYECHLNGPVSGFSGDFLSQVEPVS